MSLVKGTNCGFVLSAPVADPSGGASGSVSFRQRGFRVTAPVDGVITELGAYLTSNNGTVRLGLFTWDSGNTRPGDLIYSSGNLTKSVSDEWVVQSSLNIPIVNGTTYALGVLCSSSIFIDQDADAGELQGWASNETGVFFDPFGSWTSSNYLDAIYAVYESGGSASESPSASPSMPPGQHYTRGDYAALPSDDTDLENEYTNQDYTDVELDDGNRAAQTATEQYAIHQFKDDVGSVTTCDLSCNLQSDLAPSSSAVVLQIYNRDTPEWETVDSNNAAAADTDFTLSGNIADLTNYKDGGNIVCCRVYQQMI